MTELEALQATCSLTTGPRRRADFRRGRPRDRRRIGAVRRGLPELDGPGAAFRDRLQGRSPAMADLSTSTIR